ncbi:gluconokinase [Cellulosimicrobium arenosum]|uniref:Gluconokinase n=2 Tax=Cellulosimicrobium arenosum TaxID=2708133 RepID=A0A927PEE8_9MICO|nr:gluconokinase [Cellulosimicrobium arenosum]
MGVSGSGKSTVAGLLAARLHTTCTEADALHTATNVRTMRSGTPLTDAERQPWLESVRDRLSSEADAGRSAVVTCSALKRSYRDLLRTARGDVWFVHLDGEPELLSSRMGRRTGHFMPASLLASQLAALEPLDDDERGFVLDVAQPPEELVDEILARTRTPDVRDV